MEKTMMVLKELEKQIKEELKDATSVPVAARDDFLRGYTLAFTIARNLVRDAVDDVLEAEQEQP